jgi:O-antigen ligase
MKQPPTSSRLITLGSWVLFAAVALAPLPFGSNPPTAIAFWCIVLGAGVVLTSQAALALRPGQLAFAALAAIVVAGYSLVLYEQLAEHPLIPAQPNPVWGEAEAALGMPLVPTVAIAHGQPWLELGRPLVCLLALAGGFLVGVERERARQLIKVIAWSGIAYAVYGIISHLLDPTHILWLEKTAYLDSVTGTFVGRNSAGAYFGSCAVVWSLILWERARAMTQRRPLDWRAMASRLLSRPPRNVVVAFVMLFLCLAAMFMTRSRGASLLSLFALMIAFICFFRRDLPRRIGIVGAALGGAVLALILLETMGAGVNARFDFEGLAAGGRFETYRATMHMIAEHPWLGTGHGTFADAFPSYRNANASVLGVWDRAHNTLLEIAADMGLPIAALVTAAWLAILVRLIRGVRIRRRGVLVPAAALAVAVIAILHSLIDFSLQIPGYAIVALSLIGAGVAQSFPEDARLQTEQERDNAVVYRRDKNDLVNDRGRSKADA